MKCGDVQGKLRTILFSPCRWQVVYFRNHWISFPALIQRSWFLCCQYSYCALRSCIFSVRLPTRLFGFTCSRSLRNRQHRSMICVPDLTLNLFRSWQFVRFELYIFWCQPAECISSLDTLFFADNTVVKHTRRGSFVALSRVCVQNHLSIL